MLLLLPGARSVKLSEECKTFIACALEAWMKNPESFPCRVHGAFFGSPQDYHHETPDIIIWDPQTQFNSPWSARAFMSLTHYYEQSDGRMDRLTMIGRECCFAFKCKSF